MARELHDECSASISVEIICFDYLQQGSCEKLKPEIFLQEHVQPNASQVATMMAFWKIITVLFFECSSLRHIFCLPKASKIYGESEFESSVLQNKLGKYTFLCFKKKRIFFSFIHFSFKFCKENGCQLIRYGFNKPCK